MEVEVALERTSSGLHPVDTGKQGLSPFVKWAGGKGSIIRHLLSYVPDRFTDYYEPFLGGGALFLAICNRTTSFKAHLSDINGELINAYQVVKERPDGLKKQLALLQSEYYSTMDKEAYYYQKRAWQPESDVKSAARLIFLNKTCYNGLYRVNSKGQFNVPYGDYKKPKILNAESIDLIGSVLRKTEARIDCKDYRDSLAECRQGDFVYLDPPYHPTSKTSSFTDYTPGGFSEDDQKALAGTFAGLVDRGCHVLLSNSDTRLVRDLYKSFQLRSLLVPRPINSVGNARRDFKELIISNVA